MELNQAITSRKSIRKYKDQAINKKMIDELIEAAILAPSWKNAQTTRYYVVQSETMKEQVKACLPEFNQMNIEHAPVLIVTTFIANRSGFERDGTPSNEVANGWGYYDSGLQAMNLCLKATELGLGTLIIGIRDAQALKNALSIPDQEMIGAVISVGYADIDPQRPKRKQVEEITKYL